jgi:CDP-4-dehydro-6-deoxyglucose reductase
MSDPKFTKPWHGIPREQIEWHPIVDKDACIGCGTCVTGCSRLVYRYDYDGKKAVVADPLNCLVGCVTCSNTCPTHAISFPPLETITSLLSQTNVHHDIEDDLIARKDKLQFVDSLPHPDRIANLIVDKILRTPSDKILIVNFVPKTEDDCFCQFMPGQYIEVWIPDTQWISPAYSIGNSPRGDGSIELQIRKADGGRFTTYAFENMKIGDTLKVRGPLGTFTIKSTIDTPLLFVAGITGFAPIKSMIEQQLTLSSNRRIISIWGAHTFSEFYEFELIDKWLKTNPNFTCIFATRNINSQDRSLIPDKSRIFQESLNNVIQEESKLDLSICDGYVAGPPSMMPSIIKTLNSKGIPIERIKVDSFGS